MKLSESHWCFTCSIKVRFLRVHSQGSFESYGVVVFVCLTRQHHILEIAVQRIYAVIGSRYWNLTNRAEEQLGFADGHGRWIFTLRAAMGTYGTIEIKLGHHRAWHASVAFSLSMILRKNQTIGLILRTTFRVLMEVDIICTWDKKFKKDFESHMHRVMSK